MNLRIVGPLDELRIVLCIRGAVPRWRQTIRLRSGLPVPMCWRPCTNASTSLPAVARQQNGSTMPLTRLKEEYVEQDGVQFSMADEDGSTVVCRVSHEALRDHADACIFPVPVPFLRRIAN
jgi:hypothetical protein